MLNTIFVLVVAASAVWVYMDATSNGIGKTEGKGFINLSAGAWGVLTLLLWIIAFPVYLIKRRSLIEKAKDHPVQVGGRTGKAAILGGVGAAWAVLTVVGTMATALPSCTSSDAEQLVATIIGDMPSVKLAGIKFVSLKEVEEQGFNEQSQLRSCSATLVTTAGEDDLQFYIKWNNQEESEFYVEAQIL
ncbi:hypothetical protein [Pseudomonas sp. Q2-TVG4-2]|uniref:hypothetical protein n=1 Tax=Pseudomonas sp. Q2-TVG4-2 TaxID=1685699 RepID=UPI0015E74C1D|nr:hypothetical protein [Pseudomonas sp. Q2-TVG4-2]